MKDQTRGDIGAECGGFFEVVESFPRVSNLADFKGFRRPTPIVVEAMSATRFSRSPLALCLPAANVIVAPRAMYFNRYEGIDSFTILVPRPKIGGVEGIATLAGGTIIVRSGVAGWKLNVAEVGGLGTGGRRALLGGTVGSGIVLVEDWVGGVKVLGAMVVP